MPLNRRQGTGKSRKQTWRGRKPTGWKETTVSKVWPLCCS